MYAGYLADEGIMESSSGGAAAALAEEMISRGGCVFGVKYKNDYMAAEYCCVEEKDDLYLIKGSKYSSFELTMQDGNELKSVYEVVRKKLREGKKVLFFGLGCIIFSLKNYLKNQNESADNLYLTELICDGVTFDYILTQFVSDLEKKSGESIVSLNMRHKTGRNAIPHICARFKNGLTYINEFNKTDFGYAFNNFKVEKCYRCQFKNDNHQGDILLGDYWGCSTDSKVYNINGCSLIEPLSMHGNELLTWINTEKFVMTEINKQHAIAHNPRYLSSRVRPEEQDSFVSDVNSVGLHKAVKKSKDSRGGMMRIEEKLIDIIDEEIDKGNKKFVIFPYGKMGQRIHDLLKKEYMIEPNYIVDNRLGELVEGIMTFDVLANSNLSGEVLLFSCERKDIHDELVKSVDKIHNKIEVIDVYSRIWNEDVFDCEDRFVDFDVITDFEETIRNNRIFVYGNGEYSSEISRILKELNISFERITRGEYISKLEDISNCITVVAHEDDFGECIRELKGTELWATKLCSRFAFYKAVMTRLDMLPKDIRDVLIMKRQLFENITYHQQRIAWAKSQKDFLFSDKIAIYQAGKVGSTSLANSIKNSFQIHYLAGEGKQDKDLLKKEINDVCHSKKIITVVRNPIDRDISSAFHGSDSFPYFTNRVVCSLSMEWENNVCDYVNKYLNKLIEKGEDEFSWYEKEFKEYLDIDVYSYPFDVEKGYSIIENDGLMILIIKLEKIRESSDVIKDFIQSSQFMMRSDNNSEDKEYRFLYRTMKHRLNIDERYVEHYLNDMRALHFYTREEILKSASKYRNS